MPKSVVLELEWVMRGFYGFDPAAFCRAVEHLMGMPQATIEDWEAVKDAVELHSQGLDFADALHWSSSRSCSTFYTFDDKRFVRRGHVLGLEPEIRLAALSR